MQPDVSEKNRTGSLVDRILSRLKSSRAGDEGASHDSAATRKPVVRFQELEVGSGVAQQLKHVKDASAAATALKLKDAKDSEDKALRARGELNDQNTEILPADIDRWMPDHWLRSQYLEDVISGPDSDIATRNQMMQRYIDEEKTVSKNASTSFKFGFSKTVRMKMEQDALAAKRLADYEKMKEMQRNRLDTTTVFDVKHDIFFRGLPALQADQLPKIRLLASNWYVTSFPHCIFVTSCAGTSVSQRSRPEARRLSLRPSHYPASRKSVWTGKRSHSAAHATPDSDFQGRCVLPPRRRYCQPKQPRPALHGLLGGQCTPRVW
jgi:hypothetical protein